jgi:hypothetical protein
MLTSTAAFAGAVVAVPPELATVVDVVDGGAVVEAVLPDFALPELPQAASNTTAVKPSASRGRVVRVMGRITTAAAIRFIGPIGVNHRP